MRARRERCPLQARAGNQLAGSEPRAPRSLEECLKALEPLSIARGQLVATDGVCEVRVSVERGQVDLELLGHELPKGLQGEAAIVRALLDTAFWDAPLYDVNPGAPLALADDPKKPRPRIHVARPEAPREICRGVAAELARLEAVRRRVPSLAMTAQATPTSKDAKGGSPIAARLRAALVAKNGEVLLHDWARAEGASFSDVAAAMNELLDASEAKVARKADPASSAQRIEAALRGGGFCPGLRIERGARALVAKDAARAQAAFVRAGHERLGAGRIADALDDFTHACGPDPQSLPDLGVAAMEGLLVALEADAKDQRRAAGTEPRSPAELKRVALDLGRAYFALGLMNRARAALERAIDDAAPVPNQLELIHALAGAGQLGKALDRAEAVAPRLDRANRRSLAQKLAESARGPSLERALALAGVQSEKRVATFGAAVAGVGFVLAAAFGLQAAAASSLAATTLEAKTRLGTEGPTPALAARFESVADRYRVAPAARRARAIGTHIADLAADAKYLKAHEAELAWRRSTDPESARARIKTVLDGARTDALRARINEALAALEKAAQQCRGEADLVRAAVDANDYVAALENARKVVEHFPTWKDAWKNLRVPIRIMVERPENATVEWDGEKVSVPGTVYLRIGSGSATLNARGEPGAGWRPELRKVDLDSASSTIAISLERDPNAPRLPERRPTGTTSNPNDPSPTGSRTDPKTGRGKISIGGSTGPDPSSIGDDPDKQQPEKKGKFEVREVVGSDIQKILGGSPIDVQPSSGYFDYLASELPRDGRLRLSVDVITRVRDRKVYLDAVRLRLEDTVLGHMIPAKDVEIDDPPERPLANQANGRRAVLPLDRCVGGGSFEQGKFRAAVRDELVSMIREFNKREGQ